MKRHIAEMAPAVQSRPSDSVEPDPHFVLQRVEPNRIAHQRTCGSTSFGLAGLKLSITLIALAILWPSALLAADFSLSGFGTLGFAISDKSYRYQRFVDEDGTFRRDSVAGVQMDARFTPSIGATIQALASPSSDNDRQYDATVAWAFVSWRPNNDWLVRVGRQRIPLYLHSQNYDVGVTYAFLRLPTEMYSISPGNEFNGLSVSNSWIFPFGDLTVDGWLGSTNVSGRFWFRDGVPQFQNQGPSFRAISLTGKGLVFTLKAEQNTFRVGLLSSNGRQRNGAPLPITYPFVSLLPGVGYFQVDNSLPGPGIETVNSIKNSIATFGVDLSLGNDYQITGEYARTFVNNPIIKIANGSDRGYFSLLKRLGKWTPYVTYAFLRTDSDQRDLYSRVNGNTVPTFIPGAPILNATQRAGADAILTYDQHSWAIGTSYSLSPTSKIKAEWMRVRIGQVSSLVDAPAGRDIRNKNINVFSFSYSVVF